MTELPRPFSPHPRSVHELLFAPGSRGVLIATSRDPDAKRTFVVTPPAGTSWTARPARSPSRSRSPWRRPRRSRRETRMLVELRDAELGRPRAHSPPLRRDAGQRRPARSRVDGRARHPDERRATTGGCTPPGRGWSPRTSHWPVAGCGTSRPRQRASEPASPGRPRCPERCASAGPGIPGSRPLGAPRGGGSPTEELPRRPHDGARRLLVRQSARQRRRGHRRRRLGERQPGRLPAARPRPVRAQLLPLPRPPHPPRTPGARASRAHGERASARASGTACWKRVGCPTSSASTCGPASTPSACRPLSGTTSRWPGSVRSRRPPTTTSSPGRTSICWRTCRTGRCRRSAGVRRDDDD